MVVIFNFKYRLQGIDFFWKCNFFLHLNYTPIKKTIILLLLLTGIHLQVQSQRPNSGKENPPNRSTSQINVVQTCRYQTDVQKENLKGNIKSIDFHVYEASFEHGKLVKRRKNNEKRNPTDYRYLQEFSPSGDIISTTWYNEENVVKSIGEYAYLKPGIVSTYTNYNGKRQVRKKITYGYDANGYLISEVHTDSAGKVTATKKQKIIFISNQVVQVLKTYQEGTLVIRDTTEQRFGPDSLLLYKSLRSDKNNANHHCFKKYNGKKQLIREAYRKPNSAKGATSDTYTSEMILYEYDEMGNVTKFDHEFFEMNAARSTKSYEAFQYTYDAKGNWIKKITTGSSSLFDDGPDVVERQIKYY